jgi:DNA repair protein RAD16
MTDKFCPVCRGAVTKVVRVGANGGDASAVAAAAAAAHTASAKSKAAQTKKKESATRELTTTKSFGRSSIMQNVNANEYASSAKVDAVIGAIVAMVKKDSTAKAIVFSQYNSMVDIVEWRLSQLKIKHVKLIGYMTLVQRHAALQAFKTLAEVKVVLMSIKAGGEGLNLQEASHVFVLEPWWNPQVEHQAIQRAHRIGQTRPVTAVRFIVSDSIEERMLQLQEKKQLVFDGTIDGSAASLSSLTVDDLRFLFH